MPEPRQLPILMHARSVRNLLAGTKTQTRRIVKGVKRDHTIDLKSPTKTRAGLCTHVLDAPKYPKLCPYGQPGDLLYVRETWAVHQTWDKRAPNEIPDLAMARLWFRADGEGGPSTGRWRPSIHMPRRFARIWLRVTDVRVERVQDISTEDIWAEGVKIPTSEDGGILWRMAPSNAGGKVPASYLPGPRPIDFGALTEGDIARAFWADLWEDTNGPDAWDRNDRCWAVTFERTEAP